MRNKPLFKSIFFSAVFIVSAMTLFCISGTYKAQAADTLGTCLSTSTNRATGSAYTQRYINQTKSQCAANCNSSDSNTLVTCAWQNPSGQTEDISESEAKNAKKALDKKAEAAAEENNDVCGIKDWVGSPFHCILLLILRFAGLLLTIAAVIFDAIIDPQILNVIINNNAIYTAWSLVRDLLNIVFIFVLLYSAFCTVFQIDKYHWSKVVPNVIIMALLVNFSFPITRFIIDVSNVIMYFFINSMSSGGSIAQIASSSGIKEIINTKSPDSLFIIAAIIFTFILAMTLIVLALLLVVRAVALAILIIFSPISFVGPILPGSELASQASSWWKKLMEYSFFGPIMLFFVYVALKLMVEMSSVKNAFSNLARQQAETGTLAELIGAAAYFSIPVIILWMGMMTAKKSGVAGAGMIVGQAEKFGKKVGGWATKPVTGTLGLAKWGGQALVSRAGRKLASSEKYWWMNPKALKAAWKEREAEEERESYKLGTGAWRDKLNSIMSLGKDKTKFREAAVQNNILSEEKELKDTNQESGYLTDEFNAALKAHDGEKMAAVLRILANNNDLNDFMINQNQSMDPTNVREYLYKHLTEGGHMTKEQAAKQLSDIGEIGFSKGNFQLFGMSRFENGKYVKNEDYIKDEKGNEIGQIAQATGKASNIKAQTKADIWHWNSFLKQTADGPGELHDVGLAQLNTMSSSELGQISRARRDFFDKLSTRTDAIRNHADSLINNAKTATYSDEATKATAINKAETQANIIKEFARRVEGYKNDPNFKPDAKKEEPKKEEPKQSPILDKNGKPFMT